MPAASDRMMFPHAGCAGVEAKVVGRYSGLSVPGDDGISPICSTSRNTSPLSVFMYALSREYGSQNINGHTRGIAGRRTLINEIGSGRYYGYRRCSQISVQHPNIAMRRFIACRVCRVLAWFPSCCGLAVFSLLTVSAPDPWVLPACTPGVGGLRLQCVLVFIVHGIGCAPTRYAMGNHFVSSFDVPRMRLSFLACSVALSAVRQAVVQDGHVDRSGGRSMVARLACIAHCS